VYTGNAFDLIGERVQTDFTVNSNGKEMTESFEITLRNHKTAPVEIRVVEHLYRWYNWEMSEKSHECEKKDAQRIEFTVTLQPDEVKKINYRVRYWW
jgi:hypothetical protein